MHPDRAEISTASEEQEERRQLALLRSPLGRPGSGMVRYAAAMWYYKAGKLDAELLEAYRICSKLDHEDPAAVLASRNTGE